MGLVSLAVVWAVGLGVTFVCGVFWTGLSSTVRILAVQMIGIVTQSALVGLALATIPLPFPTWLVWGLAGAAWAYLLSDAQELYVQDAAIVTGLTALALIVPAAVGLL
jgi:hypothetical protein